MHPFFAKLTADNEERLIEMEFAAELMLCDDESIVNQALAAVSPHMLIEPHVIAVVAAIRAGSGRDPVGLYKSLKERSPFKGSVTDGRKRDPTINVFLSELMDIAIGKSFLIQRARHVVDQYRTRSARAIGGKLVGSSDRNGEIGALIRECEESLTALRAETFTEVKSLPTIMSELLASLEAKEAAVPKPMFGVDRLDRMIPGLTPGSNTIIASLTSVGKSAFAQRAALHMTKQGFRVLFFSCEMTQREVAERFLIMETGLSGDKTAEPDKLDGEERRLMIDAANLIGTLPGEVVYCPGWNVEQIEEVSHERNATAHVDVIIVDYLQLLNSAKRQESGEKKLDYIAQTIRDLGGKLGAATIVCAQLNDEAEGKKPQIRNIRGSRAPGQHANNVIMLARGKTGQDAHKCQIFVRKNRSGVLGDFTVPYVPETYEFDPADDF